jgi:very-short-patch-repair endonuclease
MTVVLIFVALFIAWHFIPKSKPSEPRPRFREDERIRVDDPQWPRFVEEHCESPAETKFLKAVIDAFGLKPQNGSLSGGGLQIDFQVEEGSYRVDFLANRWLVVEIDGATYHSSPEAQARDRVRDLYFEGLGYSILRIPAKTVFDHPQEALKRLRSALAVGKRQTEPSPPQKTGFQRLRETGSSLGRGVATLNEYVARELAKEKALSEARLVVAQEREVIELAIKSAETQLHIQEKVERDEEFERIFKQTWEEIDSLFDEPKQTSTIVVPDFPALPTHSDALTANSIKEEYEVLHQARRSLFEQTRGKLRAEPRLKPLMEEALAEIGCRNVFSRIAG